MKRGLIVLTLIAAAAASQATGSPDPRHACRAAGNDDTVRPYTPALHAGFAKAYARLFPGKRDQPTRAPLSEGYYRCMDGRLVACFVGANLPCAKIDTAKANSGAEAFCREPDNRSSAIVPMAATGHDTLYSYGCRDGRAVVSGSNWTLDKRGFAKSIWAPMN